MGADDEARMSFTEHLAELRQRLIRSFVVLIVSVLICYILSEKIFHLLAWPLTPLYTGGFLEAAPPPEGATPVTDVSGLPKWTVLNPLEVIFVYIRIAAYFGFVLALPYILSQLCGFVFPGLLPRERRAAKILIAGCSTLAIIGAVVAYFGIFPLVLPYIMMWVPEGVDVQLRMNETINIIILGLVAFAVAFQFPMAVIVLVFVGILDPQTLRNYRRHSIVVMSIVAAVLTPPDPFSLLIMLFPLVLLYEGSIWVSYLVARKRDAAAEIV